MATVWKIAPGQQAHYWDVCRENQCIALGWNDLGNYLKYKDEPAIIRALKREYGGGKGSGTGGARSIWRFAREIQPGDVVIANKGESVVVGVGRIKSGYLRPGHPKNPIPISVKDEWWNYHNTRLVEWSIVISVDLRKSYFFVANTIQRLTSDQCEQIKRAYLKEDPGLKQTLGDLFAGVEERQEGSGFADESDIEGLKIELQTTVTKRSRRLRNKAFRTAKGVCAVCHRDFARILNGRGTRVLQVHHQKQLSTRKSPAITKLTDLAVVCANCHLLLHLNPQRALNVSKLRRLLMNDGYLGS
ncbi:MAG TPA: hypothetical protein VGZ47_11605 [Gemmataceae bacterium]|jgi:hypothetical protein|nr:hypothetical protein [Gemmataceae bacterium]